MINGLRVRFQQVEKVSPIPFPPDDYLMTARAAKGRKRKRKTRPTEDKPQSARFARMEKELGIDAKEGVLGSVMDLLFPAKRRKR
jgi:hypothetical protein